LSHPTNPLCDGFFRDKVLQTVCLGLASNRYPADFCLLSS
jgi:hypothetical protein